MSGWATVPAFGDVETTTNKSFNGKTWNGTLVPELAVLSIAFRTIPGVDCAIVTSPLQAPFTKLLSTFGVTEIVAPPPTAVPERVTIPLKFVTTRLFPSLAKIVIGIG